ncbi:cytochrome ubiquinol oxidase subunit I [Leptolyngbya sp. 15MV]|nr:cytochrome ubiquinol oxidase subunit I [Leptolyngbya sp. 15MV]
MDALILARIQFAANISFHILFPTITIALGWVLLFFKLRYNATRNEAWMDAYRFWVKVFALSFALGVVSGITMSFQFGTNWPGFMERVGNTRSRSVRSRRRAGRCGDDRRHRVRHRHGPRRRGARDRGRLGLSRRRRTARGGRRAGVLDHPRTGRLPRMTRDPAFKYFMLMQLGRLAGVALVLVGLMALQGQVEVPAWAGYPMIIGGIAAFFLVPRQLARKWRSPDR